MVLSGETKECQDCKQVYPAEMPACPNCSSTASVPVAPVAAPKKNSGKIIGAAILVAGLIIVGFLVIPSLTGFSQFLGSNDTPVNILNIPTVAPKEIPREQLVQYALQLINSDRANFSLPAVQLSTNEAAQLHAEDIFSTKQISHWMTNGEKPYMTYTRYGGTGNVHQNVAIAGFTADQYQKCKVLFSACERIEPMSALKKLEEEMMYQDVACCQNGHRDNILDPHHTHVSIGIAYDTYYLAFVENFEDNYGLKTTVADGTVHITGELPSGRLKQVEVHYDPIPNRTAYEENKKLLSYSSGKLLAVIAEPPPLGYLYQQPSDYRIVIADSWSTTNNFVDVAFRLGPLLNDAGPSADGVYTTYVVVDDGQGKLFHATSYSIFVKAVPPS